MLEDNRKVLSIILASMTNKIQKQYNRLDDVPLIMLWSWGQDVFLVRKLEDLKAWLNNDTYINVILQSLPPSYDPFIDNYYMNGLEKSVHELINMLVQYEATAHKSEPAVLVGEASNSKAKGKGARCWKRKKSKGQTIVASASARGALAAPTGKGKGKVGASQRSKIWHTRLGYISKDMIRKLVDSNSLEIDDLDHLSTCKSCLKGKMTKKPFVGQSAITNGLLDWVHIDVCAPLNTPARGGFSYFITFIDDYSRYGYVYLMRYKSEAFGRFKEYRLQVENQTGRKIKSPSIRPR
ncbi:UNVERIFIED_CONTAM: hypothetical protein Sradi_7166200, partial [Sesamum radiatum]